MKREYRRYRRPTLTGTTHIDELRSPGYFSSRQTTTGGVYEQQALLYRPECR